MIDLDLEGPGLHVIFGISDGEIKVTINDVLQSAIPIRDAVLDLTSRLGIESGWLLFCPAGHRLEEILKMVDTGFNLSRFKAVLYNLATEYQLDYLLIDSHPGIEKDTIVSMAVCDVVEDRRENSKPLQSPSPNSSTLQLGRLRKPQQRSICS